jgi:hypothetical protein
MRWIGSLTSVSAYPRGVFSSINEGYWPNEDLIVPHDGQQAAMENADLFAKRPPDNKQRFDQNGQIGQVLDKLLDARLELHRSHHAHFEAEVTQSPAQVVIDGDGLGL